MTERQFNFAAVNEDLERSTKAQEDRSKFGGIDGFSEFYLKIGEPARVRFLTPFTMGINVITHEVWDNYKMHYACERNFNQDPMAHCAACGDPEYKARHLKNFLVYVYDWVGTTYENQNGQVLPSDVVGVFKLSGGKGQGYWNELKRIAEQYGGLSLVDVTITKVKTGPNPFDVDTQFTVEPQRVDTPNGPQFMVAPAPFNMDLIPPEVRAKIPPMLPEPGNINPADTNHVNALNEWGKFFLQVGKYRMPDTFTAPQQSYDNAPAPFTGQPAYNVGAPVPAQPAYQPAQQPVYAPPQAVQQPAPQPAYQPAPPQQPQAPPQQFVQGGPQVAPPPAPVPQQPVQQTAPVQQPAPQQFVQPQQVQPQANPWE